MRAARRAGIQQARPTTAHKTPPETIQENVPGSGIPTHWLWTKQTSMAVASPPTIKPMVSITGAENHTTEVFAQQGKAVEKSSVVTIEAQPSQALLLVRYAGHVTAEEAREGEQQAPSALAQLEPGFRLLADLSDLSSMDLACAPFIEKVMDLCQKKGVVDVVRVIPDPTRDIGMQIMSRFHYGRAVRIVTCETMTEAMRILSEKDDDETDSGSSGAT